MSDLQRNLDTVENALICALGLFDDFYERGTVNPLYRTTCRTQVDRLEEAHEALLNIKEQLGLSTGLLAVAQRGIGFLAQNDANP